MSVRLKTCVRCGEMDMFEQDLCHQCELEMRERFVEVKHYIEEHLGADVAEVIEGSGVDEKDVLYMVEKDWLGHRKGADDDRRRCTSCGIPISSGKLCSRCMIKAQEKLRGVMSGLEGSSAKGPAQKPAAKTKGRPDSDDSGGMYVRARKK